MERPKLIKKKLRTQLLKKAKYDVVNETEREIFSGGKIKLGIAYQQYTRIIKSISAITNSRLITITENIIKTTVFNSDLYGTRPQFIFTF
jgi:hypothetical protein